MLQTLTNLETYQYLHIIIYIHIRIPARLKGHDHIRTVVKHVRGNDIFFSFFFLHVK